MRIRRIRIVLPARLAPQALTTARLTAQAIAEGLQGDPVSPTNQTLRLDGRGQGPAMLARLAGDAARGRRRT